MSNDASQKIRLALLFGGRSGEHQVSIASAASVVQAIDRQKYDVIPVYLTPEGRWLPQVEPRHLLQHGGTPSSHAYALFSSDPQQRGLLPLSSASGTPFGSAQAIDVVFPLLHGTYGEDGTVQGLLELAGVPYIGAGVLGSAVGMDKATMKTLFKEAGLPIVPHMLVRRHDWEGAPQVVLQQILQTLTLPIFVKPANLGSSVGISKVKHAEELPVALDLASQYDRRLLIEQGLDCRELECSVLGNEEPIASVMGEIILHREFYDYEAKYSDGITDFCIPADISAALADELRRMALRAFRSIDAAGLARVDFFVERHTHKPYINEINTLPGFTQTSMYPKMWEASGIPYSELIDRLVQLALERYHDRRRTSTTYQVLPPSSASA